MTARCPAHNRQGNPCGRTAGWGTDHPGHGLCKNHGGNSPGGRKQGQRLAAEDAVVTYGLPRKIDPHTALLEELHRTAGAVAWLELCIRARGDEQVTHLIEGRDIRLRGEDEPTRFIVSETLSVWVELYQRERKHYMAVAKTCVDVGIEERRVQLQEQEGLFIARAIDGILTELGVRDRPEVPSVVRRHLTVLEGGAAAA